MSRRTRILGIAAIACVIAATRILARPRSFWELDDYIFGLSLHVFAPQASVPQPPFFPAFVFLGRFVRLFLHDDVLALTWTSVVASCASVVLVFLITRSLQADRPTALAAALLFAFFPASWFYAGLPTSDVAGLAAALLVVWLSLLASERPRLVFAAAIAFGLAFAVRAQTSVIAVVPLALAFRRSRPGRAVWALVLLAASVFVFWALPVLVAARGWRPVVEVLSRHGHYVATSTSPLTSRPGLRFLASRWAVAPWVGVGYGAAVGFLAIVGALFAGPVMRRKVLLAIIAVLPYCAIAVLLLDATFSGRYFLPMLPFAAFLAALGAGTLDRRIPGALAILTTVFIVWSAALLAPSLRTLHGRLAPAEVAAQKIREAADGRAVALLYPIELHVQAELLFPAAARFPVETTSPETLERVGDREIWRFGVSSMNDATAECWPEWKPFRTIGRGRYLVVPYGPWDKASPQFESGFYGEEREPPGGCSAPIFRWMGAEGRVRFPAKLTATVLDLRLYVPLALLPRGPEIVLDWNGSRLAGFLPASEWIDTHLPLPSGGASHRPGILTLRTSETFVPAERAGADKRRLGLQVRRLRLVGQRPSSFRSSEPGPGESKG